MGCSKCDTPLEGWVVVDGYGIELLCPECAKGENK